MKSVDGKKRKSVDEQMKIIRKGTAQIISEEELRDKLITAEREDRPLIVKLGLDPSAPDIHLGHTVVLRKIRQLQDMGHHAEIIIGDFTGKIGDPTGKSKTRKQLSKEEVKQNADTYTQQIFRVIDPDKTSIRFNSEWLAAMDFESVIRLAASTTVARLMERNDFMNRYRRQEPIGLHEFFYPLMQAYDSVEVDADIELGGTDQTFNILMGRNLQSSIGRKRQIAIFMPILEGLDGTEKMSKSLGNYIGIQEPAEIMYKKIMEVPDHLILRYYELVTDEHPDRIADMKRRMEQGENPRDCKQELAEVITGLYHDEEKTRRAKEYFHTVYQEGEYPQEIPEIELPASCNVMIEWIPFLMKAKIISSGSEFRRLVIQGGVRINKKKAANLYEAYDEKELIIKLGKKKFARLIFRA